MATIRVRSTDGSDSDNGSTWALAKAKIDNSGWTISAGDEIYLSQAHSEAKASAYSLATAGTDASPTRILCVNDGADPPTTPTTGAVISTTGASNITISGKSHLYGISFRAGVSGSSTANINISGNTVFDNCELRLESTGTFSRINPATTTNRSEWRNCNVKFGSTSQGILGGTAGRFWWNGGSVLAGGSTPGVLLQPGSNTPDVLIENVDFSNLDATFNIAAAINPPGRIILRNIKLPSGWSGALLSGSWTTNAAGRIEMWNGDAGDTNYRVWIEDYYGTIRDETTLVRSGGASVDGVGISLKMTSNSIANYLSGSLDSPLIGAKRIATVGSPMTFDVEILCDSATPLTNKDVALEMQYLGDASSPLGSRVSNLIASKISTASATNHASSAASWTTTGMSDPQPQKLSVTATPEQAGYVLPIVRLMKPSMTVYVDAALASA